jgi:hypothetical protein
VSSRAARTAAHASDRAGARRAQARRAQAPAAGAAAGASANGGCERGRARSACASAVGGHDDKCGRGRRAIARTAGPCAVRGHGGECGHGRRVRALAADPSAVSGHGGECGHGRRARARAASASAGGVQGYGDTFERAPTKAAARAWRSGSRRGKDMRRSVAMGRDATRNLSPSSLLATGVHASARTASIARARAVRCGRKQNDARLVPIGGARASVGERGEDGECGRLCRCSPRRKDSS